MDPSLYFILVSIFTLVGHQVNLCEQCVPLSWHSAAAFGLRPNQPTLGEWLSVFFSLGLMQECLPAAGISCRKPNPCRVPAKDKEKTEKEDLLWLGKGQSGHVGRMDGWVVWQGCHWKAPAWPGFTQPTPDKCSLM